MNDNRDHRRIGRELALFSFREEAPGQAFWLPEGQRLRAALLDWWRGEHAARGYREVLRRSSTTPACGSARATWPSTATRCTSSTTAARCWG